MAGELGLNGWVRNTADGAVEIVAEGPSSRLKDLAERCHRGPPAARVTAVELQWEEAQGGLSGFEMRR